MDSKNFSIAFFSAFLLACGSSGDETSGDITTSDGNIIPKVSINNTETAVAKNQTIELVASASDKDGAIDSLVWEQTAGPSILSTPVQADSIQLDLSKSSNAYPVQYSFKVTATDNQGAQSSNTFSFTANNSMTAPQAARLLHQGTMGPTFNEIQQATGLSEVEWLEQQISMPPQFHKSRLVKSPNEDSFRHINRIDAWWKASLRNQDQLRQRVAFALSEIFVVSDANNGLRSQSEAMVGYYDLLIKNAFGSYRTLLEEVTLSPVMGTYLSHLGNEKADESRNISPDENYAREVMQLFTIGLEELNLDGTAKLDADGNTIPTYDYQQITGFSRVFTGWTFADSESWKRKSRNYLEPMQAFPEYHSSKQKTLLNGVEIPEGYGPEESLTIALDNLFNHPNVGPFISKQLIKRLITSNPTPLYVQRVAAVFNNNGQGVRGDLAAVIKAIYLDNEARHFTQVLDYQGKLKEPILKTIQLWRNLSAKTLEDYYFTWNLFDTYGQGPLQSPSVFNFFRPDYQPPELQASNLTAPELQIATDTNLIGMLNHQYSNLIWGAAEGKTTLNPNRIYVYLQSDMDFLANKGIESLLDRYNLIYYAGSISSVTRQARRRPRSFHKEPHGECHTSIGDDAFSPNPRHIE